MTAIRNYYYVIPSSSTNHARQQVFHVFSETNGNYLFSEPVPIGRVTGNNYTQFPPIGTKYVQTMYWRSSFATLLQDTYSFGTLYCPEISSMNTTNGDRIPIYRSAGSSFCPELDNGFFLNVGGDKMYMQNPSSVALQLLILQKQIQVLHRSMVLQQESQHRLQIMMAATLEDLDIKLFIMEITLLEPILDLQYPMSLDDGLQVLFLQR